MGISNWGNLVSLILLRVTMLKSIQPTAIVQSVALQDPFDPSVDSALGVACT